MALCNRCKQETDLYVGGTPVCAKCDEEMEDTAKPFRVAAEIPVGECQVQPE